MGERCVAGTVQYWVHRYKMHDISGAPIISSVSERDAFPCDAGGLDLALLTTVAQKPDVG